MSHTLVILGLTFLAAFTVSRMTARVWHWLRVLFYRQRRRRYRPNNFDIPDLAILKRELSPRQELIRKSATDLLREHQEIAIREQDRYQIATATAVSATFLGFLGLSVAVTIGMYSRTLEELCAALEVSCFTLALSSFWQGMYHNARWITARVKSELLRQWCTVDNVLNPCDDKDLTTRFIEYASQIDASLCKKTGQIAFEIEQFWITRRKDLESKLMAITLDSDRVAVHFEKRPKTQAAWFDRARGRLQQQTRWRSLALLCAFTFTVILVVAKFSLVCCGVLYHLHALKDGIALLIFVAIGVSSMFTALYLNQNIRSLSHRYANQVRRIEAWLGNYIKTLEIADSQNVNKLEAEISKQLVLQIVAFEDLMVEELVDWAAISQEDVIELAPS